MWRESVLEFICHVLKAGLIAPLPGQEGYEKKSVEEIRELLRYGDAERRLDAELVWCAIYFAGTENLSELLRGLKLDCWEALNIGLSFPLGQALAELKVVRP